MNTTKILDLLSRKDVTGYYNLYSNTQWYDNEAMHLFQLSKLKRLIEHCYNNVPFYREFMRGAHLRPVDIISVEQIKLFPIITKEIIQKNYADFIPDNIKRIKGVKIGQTGGTTGNILFKRTDANTRSSTWAAFKRFEDWMAIKEGDKSLILMGGHVMQSSIKEQLRKHSTNYLKNAISFSPYDTSESNKLKIINALKKHKFALLRSYSQFLFSLSQRLKSENLTFNIRSITTTAEPLMEEHRKLFKEIFNAKIFDQYGFGEIGGVAFECEEHNGLHITEERAIVEVNDNNQLVVTDLDNFAMPFIRYFNADEAIISNEPCTCGRKSKLIKQIMGRTCDYISGLKGEFLHWAYFWHLFFDSAIAAKRNLRKFQVVQENRNELKIRLVSDELNTTEKELLISNIQSRLGMINITFSFETDIENASSGKYRPVINKLL